jgi:hypothetical protein
VLTGQGVIRLSAAGKVEWCTPFQQNERFASGDFVTLPGSGVVAFQYRSGADSGVRVMRFDPARGGKCWETTCPALGVTHTGYNHTAIVETSNGHLRVISRGDSGVFVEILDLATGRSVERESTRP